MDDLLDNDMDDLLDNDMDNLLEVSLLLLDVRQLLPDALSHLHALPFCGSCKHTPPYTTIPGKKHP